MLQQEKEKYRHDASAHDVPVIPVSSTEAYLNKNFKSFAKVSRMGRVGLANGIGLVLQVSDPGSMPGPGNQR